MPEIIRQARERIQQKQASQKPAVHSLQLPSFHAPSPAASGETPSDGLQSKRSDKDPSVIYGPAFRRDAVDGARSGVLAQTDYEPSTFESTRPMDREAKEARWLAKLPEHIQSAAPAVWKALALNDKDDRPVQVATLELLQRCRKDKRECTELARSVLERKVSRDGLSSVSPAAWSATLHAGWTPWVVATLLDSWLGRLAKLSAHDFAVERRQWIHLLRLVASHVANMSRPMRSVRAAQVDFLARVQEWSSASHEQALVDLPSLRQHLISIYSPFHAWHPNMAPAVLQWLSRASKNAASKNNKAKADPLPTYEALIDTLESLFPPPTPSSPSPTSPSDIPPAPSIFRQITDAYRTNDITTAREKLSQLAQAGHFNTYHCPSTLWKTLRRSDPHMFVFSALRFFLCPSPLHRDPSFRSAWEGLYRSTPGPAYPSIAAQTSHGLETDKAVKQWLACDREADPVALVTLQADVAKKLAAWTDQTIGPRLCAGFDKAAAKSFLYLCKGRPDLRQEVTTFATAIASMPWVRRPPCLYRASYL